MILNRWVPWRTVQVRDWVVVLLPLFLLALGPGAYAETYRIAWQSMDGGCCLSSGGNFQLWGSVGQPEPGSSTGGSMVIRGGFWDGVVPVSLEIEMFVREGGSGNTLSVYFNAHNSQPGASFVLETASGPSGTWSIRQDAVLSGQGGYFVFSFPLEPGKPVAFFRVRQIP